MCVCVYKYKLDLLFILAVSVMRRPSKNIDFLREYLKMFVFLSMTDSSLIPE